MYFKHRVPSNGWLNAFLTLHVFEWYQEDDEEYSAAQALKAGLKGQTLTIRAEDSEAVAECLHSASNSLDGQIEHMQRSDPEGTALDRKMVNPALNLYDKLIRWRWANVEEITSD